MSLCCMVGHSICGGHRAIVWCLCVVWWGIVYVLAIEPLSGVFVLCGGQRVIVRCLCVVWWVIVYVLAIEPLSGVFVLYGGA